MRSALVIVVAVVGVGVARIARGVAKEHQPPRALERPYAPSPAAARIVTLGYREMAADLAFVRLLGYFPLATSEPEASAALAEAIVGLDPMYRRVYELGAIAMTDARRQPDQKLQLRAIALLERGARMFPTYYRFPKLAGQIYIADLQTTDPVQRRSWNERGALLLESAARKPGAPAEMGIIAVELRSKLGQHQRAIENLQELFLITSDLKARREILDKLGKLQLDPSGELAAELFAQRQRFERTWKAERPAVPSTFYVLIGPPLAPGFVLADLATGGDLISTEMFEPLDPVSDPVSDPSGAPAPPAP